VCNGYETCCACAQTNQEARQSEETRRVVNFCGSICVEEFEALRELGSSTNSHNWDSDKATACVINNQDNLTQIDEELCPDDLSFECADEASG